MLNLYLVCGPAEERGIHFLSKLGVLPWTVSVDMFRALYVSPAMTLGGELEVPHQQDDLVHSKMLDIVEQRLKIGETTLVEGDFRDEHVQRYEKLAARWGYSVNVINLKARSASTLSNADFCRAVNGDLEDFTGKYREIVFIGDVHGCAAPLRRLLGKHFESDKLFVFVGDLFDRGPDNGDVFKIMMSLLDKPNVRLICGNHERHILSWLNGRDTPGEFKNNTLPQLFRHGFDRNKAKFIMDKAELLMQFSFKGANFQVSHGALADVVTRPSLFPGYQCWRGVGKRTDRIDESFELKAPADWYQVHGHSNAHNRVVAAGQRSFNLESSVEFGGKLSALAFDGVRFKDISVKSASGKTKKKREA